MEANRKAILKGPMFKHHLRTQCRASCIGDSMVCRIRQDGPTTPRPVCQTKFCLVFGKARDTGGFKYAAKIRLTYPILLIIVGVWHTVAH